MKLQKRYRRQRRKELQRGNKMQAEDPFLDVENILSLLFHNLNVEDCSDSGTSSSVTSSVNFKASDANSVDEDGRTPLHLAAELQWDSLDKINDLLIHGANIEAKDKNNSTPVYYAAKCQNWPACEMLLLKGANVVNDISKEKVVQDVLATSYRNRLIRDDKCRTVQFEINWPIFSLYNEDYDIVKQNTILHLAVCCNHADYVEILLEKGAAVNVSNRKKATPLHLAATHSSGKSQHKLMDLLIRHNANINATDFEGKTPLHKAVEMKSKEILIYLLERGANINDQDEKGMTPLHYAVKLGYDEIIEELLRLKADCNVMNHKKETPLHYAVSLGYYLTVKLLLNHGAKIEVSDVNNNTPLLISAHKDYPDIMQLLVNHGADVNAKDENERTALVMRIMENDIQSVEFLLQKNADINIKDVKGKLPIWYAVSHADVDIVKALIGAKSKIDETLLNIAVKRNKKDIVELLVSELKNLQEERDGSVLHQDNGVLLLALSNSSDDIVLLLLEEGVNMADEMWNGFTPVQCAQSLLRNDLIPCLLDKGALNVDSEDEDGETLLHKTAKGKRKGALLNIMKFVCTATKNYLEKDKDGNTPLHTACAKGRPSLVKYLAKSCGKECLTMENGEGLTPLEVARKKKRTSLVKVLEIPS